MKLKLILATFVWCGSFTVFGQDEPIRRPVYRSGPAEPNTLPTPGDYDYRKNQYIEQGLIDDLTPEARREMLKPAEGSKQQAAAPKKTRLPESLEAAIAVALQTNPDVRVADAKLRMAEAESDQVRLRVVHDVTKAYGDWLGVKKLDERGMSSKTTLAEKESRLKYLLGLQTSAGRTSPWWRASSDERLRRQNPNDPRKSTRDSTKWKWYGNGPEFHYPEPTPILQGSATPAMEDDEQSPQEKTLEKLKTSRTKCEFSDEPLDQALDQLSKASGIPFVTHRRVQDANVSITASLGDTPVHDALAAISDLTRVAFVIRDYGVLATHHYSRGDAVIISKDGLKVNDFRVSLERNWGIEPGDYPLTVFADKLRSETGKPVVVRPYVIEHFESVQVPISGQVRDVLQAVGDTQNLRFKFREYGTLISQK